MVEKIVTSIGKFSYRNRKIIAALALVIFICVAVLQSYATIEYSYAEDSVVAEIFPQDDTLLIVYSNNDEASIKQVIEYLEKDEHVTSIQSYANTLGLEMSPADISEMMGIDVTLVNTLFYIREYGMEIEGMTLVDFVSFISSDAFLNNEMFSSMIDDDTKAQISMMQSIVMALASDTEYTAKEIADMLDIDDTLVETIFYIAGFKNSTALNAPATVLATIAEMLGMDPEAIQEAFGVTPVKAMRFVDFVDLVIEVSGYAESLIDSEQLAQLEMLKQMSDIVREERELLPAELAELFSAYAEGGAFTEENLSLLYVMVQSTKADMSEVRISLYDVFIFICEDVVTNEAFSSFFDESVASQLEEAKATMEDGITQLIGAEHSRMVVTLDYVPDSQEIKKFYDDFNDVLGDLFSEEYFLVGATAMSDEVSKSFSEEYRIISIVTAVAVFAVVLLTFKKLFVSLLLIFVIEGAVFSMMSVMTVTGSPMYFIALILVQCILMGSMIDYGILFTSYYMEVRKEYSVEEALPEVMRRATYAILMSSVTLIVVTFVCGLFMTGAVASILKTLSIGATCAILLIMFALPSLLVIFDKYFIPGSGEAEEEVDPFD